MPQTSKPTRYVTTAIPYVNAPPHIGFALELVQADCLARFYQTQGYDVRLQTGTDENSLKNVIAAEAVGLSTADLVARNARYFARLAAVLNIRADGFIRTSADARHRLGVERLWRTAAAKGDIYKKPYRGLYCTGCEQFYKAADLVDGLCPEHRTQPEDIAEENYFFRLSRYSGALRDLVTSGRLSIVPQTRRNEVLRWLESGLEDFSISRSSQRARGWGLPVPGDPDQVIYVWFDALGNYVTALDFDVEGELYERFWRHSERREHVVGKGITRFHAVYWPAMLLSAGLPLPDRILVHGYVTVDGDKIGKSAGNAIDPIPLAEEFGADALRYYLLRHIRTAEDGDFGHDRLVQTYHAELAGQLGNLANRILSLIERYSDGVVPNRPANVEHPMLAAAADELGDKVAEKVGRFALDDGLAAIWDVVGEANRHVTRTAPWDLARCLAASSDDLAKVGARAQLDACLYDLAAALDAIARACWPFMPAASEKLLTQLGLRAATDHLPLAGRRVRRGDVLFPR